MWETANISHWLECQILGVTGDEAGEVSSGQIMEGGIYQAKEFDFYLRLVKCV